MGGWVTRDIIILSGPFTKYSRNFNTTRHFDCEQCRIKHVMDFFNYLKITATICVWKMKRIWKNVLCLRKAELQNKFCCFIIPGERFAPRIFSYPCISYVQKLPAWFLKTENKLWNRFSNKNNVKKIYYVSYMREKYIRLM